MTTLSKFDRNFQEGMIKTASVPAKSVSASKENYFNSIQKRYKPVFSIGIMVGALLILAGILGRSYLAIPELSSVAAQESPKELSFDALLPDSSQMARFEEQTPILFISKGQNKSEWDKLKQFWNEDTETVTNPITSQLVKRKVIKIKMPLGLNVVPNIPSENPMTLGKWELGKAIYFDPILSSDGTVSCSSCHAPETGFSDGRRVSLGIHMNKGGMNAPTVFNSVFNPLQFWDGRAASLEDQAQGPPQNPLEMFDGKGNAWHEAVKRFRANPTYNKQFLREFGHIPTRDAIAKAIATYERTVLIGNAIADRAAVAMRERVSEEESQNFTVLPKDYETVILKAYGNKDLHALTALELTGNLETDKNKIATVSKQISEGQKLFFGKARCTNCHVGESFTDYSFHNLGVGVIDGKLPPGSEGRFGAQPTGHKNPIDYGAFKTPPLRGLLASKPYMHDGKEKSLMEVIEFYDRGGNANEFLDQKMRDLDAELAYMKAKMQNKAWTAPPVKCFTRSGQPIIPFALHLTPEEKKSLEMYMRALESDPVDAVLLSPKK